MTIVYMLRVEWRAEFGAKPVGSFSLAGAQVKFSAVKREWPYAVCDNCKRESRAKDDIITAAVTV